MDLFAVAVAEARPTVAALLPVVKGLGARGTRRLLPVRLIVLRVDSGGRLGHAAGRRHRGAAGAAAAALTL